MVSFNNSVIVIRDEINPFGWECHSTVIMNITISISGNIYVGSEKRKDGIHPNQSVPSFRATQYELAILNMNGGEKSPAGYVRGVLPLHAFVESPRS